MVFQGSFVTKVTPLPHRHARIRVYFRRDKGRRVALPPRIGSDEFRAAYQAAITGQSVVKREQLSSAPTGRIAALVISYVRSSAYVGLRATTKAAYATPINVLREKHVIGAWPG